MAKKLTTSTGAPITDDNNTVTAGRKGPVTLDNISLFEKLAHFNRERIPERVVHARGSGAYGYFELEKDLSEYTIAQFLQKNKIGIKTKIFTRFSTVGGGQDSGDYVRDPRGFAVKFYTEEGNWDMVGNNTPVFFIRDPQKFPDFVHSQKKNPKTNLPDPIAMYEFLANYPPALHQLTILMSDRGIPKSYRHMNGYASHTLSFWNKNGERFWVKWHFKTNQGIETVRNEEAKKLPPHGAQEDLVKNISEGNFPSWAVKLQIMSEGELENYRINPFDLTKVWPHEDFPLITIGKIVLDTNVENYFAETEQAAFSPGNFVPGIGGSPDKVLQARLLSYPDAQRYRIGVNGNQLPVNAPISPANHYQRDGNMAGMYTSHEHDNYNQHGGVNFFPNDRKGPGVPKPDLSHSEPPLSLNGGTIRAYDTMHSDNFSQAGQLFKLMNQDQKEQLAHNIAQGLSKAPKNIIERMMEQFKAADVAYEKLVQDKIKEITD